MNVPPASAPGQLYCLDTSYLKTHEEEIVLFLALDTFTGKIVHTEVHPFDKEGAFLHFIEVFIQNEKLSAEHKARIILSLDKGLEKDIEEAFPVFAHVTCDKELCRSITGAAWQFIYELLEKGN
ncbi:MAG: hypothetical protein EP332_09110 [Bacteroidetes bacterium]|nr:MAG: hypothetical protein EP332_09110 [Bacteroidota bacterium]